MKARDTVRQTNRRTTGRRAAVGALLGLGLAAAGCLYDEDPNTFHTQGRMPSAPPKAVPRTFGYPPEPPVCAVDALEPFIQQFEGRVVLLDVWATWCLRNRDEMPRVAQLQDELRGAGFQVVALSLDEPSEWSTRIIPFLTSAGANFPCLVLPRSHKNYLRQWLAPEWDYSLPMRFLFDGRGELIGRFGERSTIDQVAAAAEQAVGGAAAAAVASAGGRLRVRLVDVAGGRAEALRSRPAAQPLGDAGERVADEIAGLVPNKTLRVAVAPVLVGEQGGYDDESVRLGDELIDSLRHAGFMDVIEPAVVRRELEARGVSPWAVEFDPVVLRGQMKADYFVFSRLDSPGRTGPDLEAATADSQAIGRKQAVTP